MVRRDPAFGQIRVFKDFEPLPKFRAKRSEIDQIFVNMVMNAIQAMEGEGELSLATRSTGNAVLAEVTDTGCGIPPAIQTKIFDPFFTTKDPGKGTGLGLSIVYKIVSKYAGTVKVESEVGMGTRFLVQFPIRS
jgi:signal transduction histidine kinase